LILSECGCVQQKRRDRHNPDVNGNPGS